MSDKIIKPPDTTLAPTSGFKNDGKKYFTFRDCLIQGKAKSEYDKITNIYIAYDLHQILIIIQTLSNQKY